jgi:hypothetical protein
VQCHLPLCFANHSPLVGLTQAAIHIQQPSKLKKTIKTVREMSMNLIPGVIHTAQVIPDSRVSCENLCDKWTERENYSSCILNVCTDAASFEL